MNCRALAKRLNAVAGRVVLHSREFGDYDAVERSKQDTLRRIPPDLRKQSPRHRLILCGRKK